MKYIKMLDSGDELKIINGFAGELKVFWNGVKIKKIKGSYYVNIDNESKLLVVESHKFLGFPIVFLDDKEIVIVKKLKLKRYEWVLSALPLILMFVGGAIGGLIGGIGFSINVLIFRLKLPSSVKIILSLILLPVFVVIYFVLAGLFLYSIQ